MIKEESMCVCVREREREKEKHPPQKIDGSQGNFVLISFIKFNIDSWAVIGEDQVGEKRILCHQHLSSIPVSHISFLAEEEKL